MRSDGQHHDTAHSQVSGKDSLLSKLIVWEGGREDAMETEQGWHVCAKFFGLAATSLLRLKRISLTIATIFPTFSSPLRSCAVFLRRRCISLGPSFVQIWDSTLDTVLTCDWPSIPARPIFHNDTLRRPLPLLMGVARKSRCSLERWSVKPKEKNCQEAEL